MKATNKDGKRNATTIKRVVKLRDEDKLSWTNIRKELANGKVPIVISGSTVRRIYNEGKGYAGAHYDSRPLSGGRYRADKRPEAEATPKPSEVKQDASRTRQTAASTKQKANASKAKTAAKRAPAKKAPAKRATKATTAETPAPSTDEATTAQPAQEQAS